MTDQSRALAQLGCVLVLSALTALLAKVIALPVNQIIFGRSVIAGLGLLLFLRWTGRPIRLAGRGEYLFFLFTGCLLGIHWLTYFQSIRVSTVAVGMIALYTYPVISTILEPFFDRRPHRVGDLVIGLIVFGGVLLMAPTLELGDGTTRGILWGVLSALVYSVRNILVRRHVKKYPAPTVMLHQVTAISLMLLPSLALNFAAFDILEVPNLLLLGLVFTAVHHSLIAAALRHFSARTVSVITSAQPMLGALFAFLLLHEAPALRTIAGGTIVVGAAVFEAGRQVSRRPRAGG